MDFSTVVSTFSRVAAGLSATTLLFAITLAISLPLGFVLMAAQRSRFTALRLFVDAFIYLIRSTPLLLQLLFVYFGLPLLPVVGKFLVMQRFSAAIVGFVLNYAAYFSEIFRGGLMSVDKGQTEASKALGLNGFQRFWYILMPQLLRVAMPSVSNETITLVKDTALLYAVSVPEVLHFAKATVNSTSSTFAFVVAGIIYLIFNAVISYILK
ncbi:MAG: amino acid ABC transporter permease, partial [Oscillospiraceae bacterium]